RNLLIARMKITSYNLHCSAPSSRALVAHHAKSTRVPGADLLMKSNPAFPSGVRDLGLIARHLGRWDTTRIDRTGCGYPRSPSTLNHYLTWSPTYKTLSTPRSPHACPRSRPTNLRSPRLQPLLPPQNRRTRRHRQQPLLPR